ncbi:hypothetical protein [Streptomyces sp. N35]|uniref:hypothetical protein n=1 Tax=Streptomyces sp. N35 TaxID=2795730 RepID=UPI0018F43C75|nr:hypothetical protein [Streptomyces sp. N35]
MTAAVQDTGQLVERADKFVDYTEVGWIDIILNIAGILAILGLLSWIVWGVMERRHGVRGAARRIEEKGNTTPGRRINTRVILAVLSVVGSLVLLGFGIALNGRSGSLGENAGLMLVEAVLFLGLWLFAGVFWRPRKWRDVPEEPAGGAGERGGKESSEKSAEGVDSAGSRSTQG